MKTVKEYMLALHAIDEKDGRSYLSAYDALIWAIASSPMCDLEDIVTDLLMGPYDKLPIPMQVMIARIVALNSVSIGDKETFDHAELILSLYGDPVTTKRIAVHWPEQRSEK